jgi:hypothetical protein
MGECGTTGEKLRQQRGKKGEDLARIIFDCSKGCRFRRAEGQSGEAEKN